MRFVVSATPEKAARAAARQIARRLRTAIGERGVATLALSGGSTAPVLHGELAHLPIDWEKVHVFQVDERIAPDPSRNLPAISNALGRSKLHAMPVDAANAVQAARDYADELIAVAGDPPVLDVVQLGLGADGHTASLFPGDAAMAATDPVACTGEQAGFRRMTLALPVINAARNIIWYVTGAAKREPLAHLATRGWQAPAGRIARRQSVIYTDRAARGE